MKRIMMLSTTGEFLGKAALVTIFTFLAVLKLASINGRIAAWDQSHGAEKYVDLSADVAGLGFLILLLMLTTTRLRPNRTAEGWEPRISALVGSFLSFSLVALPQAELGPAWRATGVILIAVGMVLSILVLARLGRSFSIVPQARRLVTTGPYAYVRHPLCLCEEIAIVGVAVVHFSALAVLILVIQWIFQLRRMVNEERLLRSHFPEYASYATATPRIIPWPRHGAIVRLAGRAIAPSAYFPRGAKRALGAETDQAEA